MMATSESKRVSLVVDFLLLQPRKLAYQCQLFNVVRGGFTVSVKNRGIRAYHGYRGVGVRGVRENRTNPPMRARWFRPLQCPPLGPTKGPGPV